MFNTSYHLFIILILLHLNSNRKFLQSWGCWISELKSMAFLSLLHVLSAQALPHSQARGQGWATFLTSRDETRTMFAGEGPADRTIFTMVSLFCMMTLSLLLGSRFSSLRRTVVVKRNMTSILVFAMYFLVMSFVVSMAAMISGQGLYTYRLCYGATWICLILYTFSKGVIYLFLVERIHVVRAPFVRRSRDWMYISCLILMIVSFGAVAINAYLSPIIEMTDGRCHMGIPAKASFPFMAVDIAVDVALTAAFFYLLRPVVKGPGVSTVSGVLSKSMTVVEILSRDTIVQKNIRTLLWKSLIASLLIMLPTVANMIQFSVTKGRELAIICTTICVIDVSWDAVVIHWLTFGSAEAEKNLIRHTRTSSQRAPSSGRNSSIMSEESPIHEARVNTESPLPKPPSARSYHGSAAELLNEREFKNQSTK